MWYINELEEEHIKNTLYLAPNLAESYFFYWKTKRSQELDANLQYVCFTGMFLYYILFNGIGSSCLLHIPCVSFHCINHWFHW